MPWLLLLLIAAPASASTVTMDGARWSSLQPDRPEPADPLQPRVVDRTVSLRVGPERVDVDATWRIDPGERTWFAERILGFDASIEQVWWNGRPARAHAVRRGYMVLERPRGPSTLRVVASVPRGAALDLLDAPRGVAALIGEDVALGGRAVPEGDRWRLPPGPLVVQAAPPTARPGSLIDAHVAVGLTVEDGVAAGRARVRWVPRRGVLQTLQLRAGDVGEDLQVEGPDVAQVSRAGGLITVALRAPLEQPTWLDLRWTTSLPDADEARLAVPSLEPVGVHRVERSLQLARSGEREVVPELTGRAVASWELPESAQGLVVGTPTAAWQGPVRGSIGLLRYVPADSPPAIVDVAEYTAAASDGGRVLVQARYAVRSDRAPALVLTPPPGVTLLAVRVDGRAEPPALTADGRWRVSLPRSVESVDGLVSFPVELAWLQSGEAWSARDHRELPLPSVDAPVAVQRATVYLPPGFRALRAEDGDRRVEAFSRGEGIRYGFALDEDGESKKEQADALFGAAVGAWKTNDFDRAQGYLDALGTLGASNADVSRLQRNLDVVDGTADDDGITARRVKEQARARSKTKKRLYDRRRREAEEYAHRGDRAASTRAAAEALALGGELQKLEQRESVEYRAAERSLQAQIAPQAGEALPVDEPEPEPTIARRPPAPRPTTAAVDPSSSGLDKFGYGDPDEDQWFGRDGVDFAYGVGGLGARGSGFGSGGSASGHGSISRAPAVAVVAATRSIPIPRVGQPVHFQRLLLPAGASPTLPLRARRAPGGT